MDYKRENKLKFIIIFAGHDANFHWKETNNVFTYLFDCLDGYNLIKNDN